MARRTYIQLPKLTELRKYRLSTIRGWLRANLYSPKDRAKIRKMLPKSSRTLEGQWWDIHAKYGRKIRKQQFVEFFTERRRAKRKVNRLKKEGVLLRAPAISSGINEILKAEYGVGLSTFKLRRMEIKKILQRDYVRKHNELQKWKLYQNIIQTFEYSELAYKVANRFMNMTSVEINNFFKANKGFNKLLRGSPRSILEYIETVNWELENLAETQNNYIKAHKINA